MSTTFSSMHAHVENSQSVKIKIYSFLLNFFTNITVIEITFKIYFV